MLHVFFSSSVSLKAWKPTRYQSILTHFTQLLFCKMNCNVQVGLLKSFSSSLTSLKASFSVFLSALILHSRSRGCWGPSQLSKGGRQGTPVYHGAPKTSFISFYDKQLENNACGGGGTHINCSVVICTPLVINLMRELSLRFSNIRFFVRVCVPECAEGHSFIEHPAYFVFP